MVVKPHPSNESSYGKYNFFGQLYYNLSHALFPRDACVSIPTHAYTAQIFLHIQLLISLNLTPLRDQLGHLWLVCGNMHSMCWWPTSEVRAFLKAIIKSTAAVLCHFYCINAQQSRVLHNRDIDYSGHVFAHFHSSYGSLFIRMKSG